MKKLLLAFLLFAIPCMGQRLLPQGSGAITASVQDGQDYQVFLVGNVTSVSLATTSATPNNLQVTLRFTQNSVGGWTVTFGGNITTSCSITSTANSTSICRLQYSVGSNAWTDAGIGGGTPTSANQLDPTQAPYNVPVGIVSGTPTGNQYLAKSGNDGGSTNTSPTFTSTNQNCAASDIGSLMIVNTNASATFPYGQGLVTVVGCNGNAWTLSANATSTTSNLFWALGKDAGAGLASARLAAVANGQHLAIPCGVMMVTTLPFPKPPNLNFMIQNQDITGCSTEQGGSHFILHPNITTTANADGAIFAEAAGTVATGTIGLNGIQGTARISNIHIMGLAGTMTKNSAGTLIFGYAAADDIAVFGVCINSFTYLSQSGGENHFSRLNFQPQCQSGIVPNGVAMSGQGTNTVTDSIMAYGGIAFSCTSGAICNLNDSYITQEAIGVSCSATCTTKLTGNSITVTGGLGSQGAIYDGNSVSTFYVFGNIINGSVNNFPAVTLSNAGSILDVSGTQFTSSTAGCIIAGSGTVNDRVGNSFQFPLNGTSNCAFTGKYVPIGGGSASNNSSSATTNFGTNLGSTNILTAVSPGAASYDVKIGFRQVTAGVGCSAASNTVNGVLSWTSGGVTQSTGSGGVPALGTLTISANGSVGSSSAYTSQPVHVDVNTQITFTTTSVLASTGCSTTPQYVVDFSTI